jgi:hypothetical protein
MEKKSSVEYGRLDSIVQSDKNKMVSSVLHLNNATMRYRPRSDDTVTFGQFSRKNQIWANFDREKQYLAVECTELTGGPRLPRCVGRKCFRHCAILCSVGL